MVEKLLVSLISGYGVVRINNEVIVSCNYTEKNAHMANKAAVSALDSSNSISVYLIYIYRERIHHDLQQF